MHTQLAISQRHVKTHVQAYIELVIDRIYQPSGAELVLVWVCL